MVCFGYGECGQIRFYFFMMENHLNFFRHNCKNRPCADGPFWAAREGELRVWLDGKIGWVANKNH